MSPEAATVVARGAPATALRRARLGDVPAMAHLINGYAARGLMLPKAPADLYRLFREYRVVTDAAGAVVACGGLRVYSPDLAEIVGLAVAEGMRGRGLGGDLVRRLVSDARGLGLARVFAMTLEEPFFHGLGFRTVPRAGLPEKEGADCRGCARRAGCPEIAVLRDLRAPDAAPAAPLRRTLRVLRGGEATPSPGG